MHRVGFLKGVGLALVGLFWLAGLAKGQGFSVYEQSICAMGRASTGVAAPCADGSAVFFNPAGIAQLKYITATAGVMMVRANGHFIDDYTEVKTQLDDAPLFVPHLYLGMPVNERLAVALGVYVPYGLETKWPKDFDGAFLGYNSGVQSIYIQPTVAYRVTDQLSIGAGPVVNIASVKLKQLADLSAVPVPGAGGLTFAALGIPFHTAFADGDLKGNGTGFGGHVGVLFELNERVTLGARYLSQIKVDYDGDVSFSQVPTGILLPADFTLPDGTQLPKGTPLDAILASQFSTGTLSPQGAKTSITMPAQLVVGLKLQATDALTLMADYQWTGWSSFDKLEVDFEKAPDRTLEENYRDTNTYRVGATYQINPRVQVRLGYIYNEAAAPDETVTPLLPDANRNHFTAGLGIQATDMIQMNFAYQFIRQDDRRGRTVEGPNNGLYEFTASLAALSISVNF